MPIKLIKKKKKKKKILHYYLMNMHMFVWWNFTFSVSLLGKFIAFLGNCLVKCAKNEHDESLSLEPVSQGKWYKSESEDIFERIEPWSFY